MFTTQKAIRTLGMVTFAVMLTMSASVRADWDDHPDQWEHNRGHAKHETHVAPSREHEWMEHNWREQQRREREAWEEREEREEREHHGPRPMVVYRTIHPPVYYQPGYVVGQPQIMYPAPVYVEPASPSINFVFPLDLN